MIFKFVSIQYLDATELDNVDKSVSFDLQRIEVLY